MCVGSLVVDKWKRLGSHFAGASTRHNSRRGWISSWTVRLGEVRFTGAAWNTPTGFLQTPNVLIYLCFYVQPLIYSVRSPFTQFANSPPSFPICFIYELLLSSVFWRLQLLVFRLNLLGNTRLSLLLTSTPVGLFSACTDTILTLSHHSACSFPCLPVPLVSLQPCFN